MAMKISTIAKRADSLADAIVTMNRADAYAIGCRTYEADGEYGDAARAFRKLREALIAWSETYGNESDRALAACIRNP